LPSGRKHYHLDIDSHNQDEIVHSFKISWAACFALATDALDTNPSLPTQSPTMYKFSAILGSGLLPNLPFAAVIRALDTTMLGNGLFLTSTCLHPGCSKSRNSSNSGCLIPGDREKEPVCSERVLYSIYSAA
jgi:hypothetical protein